MIPSQLGWVVMEIISPIMLGYFFLTGPLEKSIASYVFFILWIGHYFNRSIIYPIRQNSPSKMPLLIPLLAFMFNIVNGFVNGYHLGFIQAYPLEYIYEWNFILGIILFVIGAIINIKSDNILLRLRSNNKGYHIPNGFMFRYVSYPNYLGEIMEWVAFALMTWSLAGLSFAVWTIANLVPRAIAGHKWYKETFDNYPKNRKAILPHIL
jgi:3-oxo-5-alpha-steroid 4-dehydrogenase 1